MTLTPELRAQLAAYSPPAQVIHDLLEVTPVVLLVGITAAGKDTIKRQMMERFASRYHRIVSHTTRAPRINDGVPEKDGADYHFIDLVAAKHMLDNQAFVEAKEFSNNMYGTSIAELQLAHDEGKIALADPEIQGAATYMEFSPKVRPIFILPPDYDTWQGRFLKRYGEHVEDYAQDIARRLQTNKHELAFALSKDYFSFIINDTLDDAVNAANAIAQGQRQSSTERQAARQVGQAILDRLSSQQ